MRFAAPLIAAVLLAGCKATDCCVDNFGTAYGRVYGVVRLDTQQPAAGVIVRTEGSEGVQTDSAGNYSLGLVLRGMAADTLRVVVRAVRLSAPSTPMDSVEVQARVPMYPALPVLDSAHVDIVLPPAP